MEVVVFTVVGTVDTVVTVVLVVRFDMLVSWKSTRLCVAAVCVGNRNEKRDVCVTPVTASSVIRISGNTAYSLFFIKPPRFAEMSNK